MANSSTGASAAESPARTCDRVLVIGYGNELRGDDGVGVRVAEAIEALRLPGVEVIACHQLTPDLAEPISRVDRVIFADAVLCVEGDGASCEVEVSEVMPQSSGGLSPHTSDPGALMALTRALYGGCPPAWCLAIPARSFELGFGLTPFTQQAMEQAVEVVRRLAGPQGA